MPETEKWVDLYGDYLFNYAIFKGIDEEQSKDLVQDTFLAALKSFDKFKSKSSVKTWLVSILRHKIADFYRKSYKENSEELEDYKLPFDAQGHWDNSRVPKTWKLNDNSKVESSEFNKFLLFCISLLPKKWRSIFILKHLEEETTEKICKETNISSSNYWVIMHRSRLKLRECLEKNYFDK